MVRRTEMKKIGIPLILIVLSFILALANGCVKGVSPEEIKSWMEIVDVNTNWVSKYYQPWPPRLILVPSISFRVKNISSKPLRYINFNAIFKFKDDYENLGDNFLAGIRGEAVMPGQLSQVIVMKSNFGVEGKSLDSFKDNPRWRIVFVKLYAVTRGAQHVLIGEWQVSQKIDFKEPEPVGIKKSE